MRSKTLTDAIKKPAIVAVDLGAESCRVSLLRWAGGAPRLKLVHRSLNSPVQTAQGLRWDFEQMFAEVCAGLARCAVLAPEGSTMFRVLDQRCHWRPADR